MKIDIFNNLNKDNITVHVLMDMQKRYPNLTKSELISYYNRTKLRVSLLVKFAKSNSLAVNEDLIKRVIPKINSGMLDKIFDELYINSNLYQSKNTKGWVYLLNGGPATGKSMFIQNMKVPPNTITLDRDSYFEHLTPYKRLTIEHPNHATHAVVCEAILYNERDAYNYALIAGAENILVDGTMSYIDLGIEMIQNAKENGYKVKVINIDCPIELAIERAEKRAKQTGKTINTKLLYESHVRCAKNFFEYKKIATATENWLSTQNGELNLSANSEKIFNKQAIKNLRDKGELPLDNPSWPANFDDFLAHYSK